jgi:surface protein
VRKKGKMKKQIISAIILLLALATIVNASIFTLKGSVTTTANDVWVDDNIIYITSLNGGIQAYSFNGTEFTLLDTYTTSYALSVFGDGTYIYVADFNDGLYALTFNGTEFTSVGNISGSWNNGIWTDGYIYVARQSYGIEAYSFNGTDFTLLNSTYDADVTTNVFGDGTYIYASVTADTYTTAKLIAYTFDGNSFTKVSETNFSQTADSNDLWGDGTYIYLANGDGVKAYTFNGIEFIEIDAIGNTGDITFSVWGEGTIIYATEYGTDELTAYSFNGVSFTEIANTYSPNPMFLWGDGTYVYVAEEAGGITAYELSSNKNVINISDDFNRADNTSLGTDLNGNVWAVYSGNFPSGYCNILNNEIECFDSNNQGEVVYIDGGFDGYEKMICEASFRNPEAEGVANQEARVVCEKNAGINGVIVSCNSGGFQLSGAGNYYKYNIGSCSNDIQYDVKIQHHEDNNFSVYIDDILIVNHSSDYYDDSSSYALFGDFNLIFASGNSVNKTAYFDNINVYQEVETTTCSSCNETCSPCGGGCTATDLSNMYADTSDFDATYGDITGWNTSCITSFANTFARSDFNQDISGWDTANIVDMTTMFDGNKFFNQSIGSWDTSKVTAMEGMFYCDYGAGYVCAFNQPIDNWNVSSVINFVMMFDSSSFNQPIGSWDTSSVTDMANMFNGALDFNQDISGWDVTNLTDATDMFIGSSGLSVANYDALLNGWASQIVQMGVPFDAGNSQYSSAGLSARNTTLIGTYGWTITDGGLYEAPCTPNWTCDTYSVCNSSNIMPCNAVADLNFCGTNFTGDLSDYDDVCTYVPSGIIYRESTDLTGAVVDNGTKIIVGFGAIALLFGLAVAGVGVAYTIRKLIIKK